MKKNILAVFVLGLFLCFGFVSFTHEASACAQLVYCEPPMVCSDPPVGTPGATTYADACVPVPGVCWTYDDPSDPACSGAGGGKTGGGATNNAPYAPTITGPITGSPATSYSFDLYSIDPDVDDIRYEIDWDSDGTSDETSPVQTPYVTGPGGAVYTPSEYGYTLNHTWSSNGTKSFKVRAVDTSNSSSVWVGHTIIIGTASAAPTVLISANPLSVSSGGTTNISWSTTDATSCTASSNPNVWNGSKATSGSENSVGLTSATTFTLECSGPGGTSSSSVTVSVTNNNPYGWLDGVGCSSFDGWALDPDTTNSIQVDFFANGPVGVGILVGSVTANGSRPDVTAATGVAGDHGFSFGTPGSLKDGVSHDIYAYGVHGAETGLLWGTPKTIVCSSSAPVTNLGGSTSLIVGQTGTWNFNASDADGDLARWRFRASTDTGNPWTNISGAFQSGTHSQSFSSVGTYTWILEAQDSQNLSDSSSISVTVTSGTCTDASAKNNGGPLPCQYYQCNDGIDNDGDGKTDMADPGCSGPSDDDETDPVLPGVPSVSINASPLSIVSGNSSTLTWTSANATSCTASGAWSGSKATSGTQSVSPVVTATYSITCTGPGGSANDSVTVTVTAGVPAPTLSFTADSYSVFWGGSTILRWTTTDATSCTASSDWSGAKAVNGNQSTGVLWSDKTYTLSCSGPGGSVIRSLSVNVGTAPACSDGLDNDGDGKIDFGNDPGCSDPSDSDETDTTPKAQCSDGLDNDGDGKTDAADPGCHSDNNASNPASYDPNDTSEIDGGGGSTQCSDSIDNDGDGQVDYPSDLGCTSPVDNDETNGAGLPECSDGIDNTDPEDVLIDMADPGCTNASDTSEVDTAAPVSFTFDGPTVLPIKFVGLAGADSMKGTMSINPVGGFTSPVTITFISATEKTTGNPPPSGTQILVSLGGQPFSASATASMTWDSGKGQYVDASGNIGLQVQVRFTKAVSTPYNVLFEAVGGGITDQHTIVVDSKATNPDYSEI